jgi:hypothetical protein
METKSVAQLRDAAMQRAAAAIAAYDPSDTVGEGPSCYACGEECGDDADANNGRLARFSCARGAGSDGHGRGSGSARGCDWRLCYFCANALSTGIKVCCDVCGLEAMDRDDDENDSDEESSESGSGCSSDSAEVDDADDDAGDDEEEQDQSSWGGRGRGRGRGRGGSRGDVDVPSSSSAQKETAELPPPRAKDTEDDLFALALPTHMPSIPSMASLPRNAAPDASGSSTSKANKAKSGDKRCRDERNGGGDNDEDSDSSDDSNDGEEEDSRFADRAIDCRDCGSRFVFSAADQCRLFKKGFTEPNKTRCASCTQFKKNRFAPKIRDGTEADNRVPSAFGKGAKGKGGGKGGKGKGGKGGKGKGGKGGMKAKVGKGRGRGGGYHL